MTDPTSLARQCFSLTYLDDFNIKDEDRGLNEPSGLALSNGRNALWTVSDDTKAIFKLSLDGDLKKDDSFKIPDVGMEGIALDPSGTFLFAVKEDHNEIIKIEVDAQEVVDRQRLADMAGYETIAGFFAGSGGNKGLEGITWRNGTDTIFVLKEGEPGLLVEVTSDLRKIEAHRVLNAENGFLDPDVSPEEMDFSGICYDSKRDRFWIVSDKAQRLFLYDSKANTVVQSATLGYGEDGEYEEIEKAEGIAIDADANRLYVVSDEEARLYVFDIRE